MQQREGLSLIDPNPSHSEQKENNNYVVATGDKGWFPKQHAQQHANRLPFALLHSISLWHEGVKCGEGVVQERTSQRDRVPQVPEGLTPRR